MRFSNEDKESPLDAVERSRRTTRRILWACGACIVTCSVWAFVPIAMVRVPPPPPASPIADSGTISPRPVREEAFTVALWPEQPIEVQATKPPEPPPPPPPLKLQLLGIIADHGVRRAMLFDPDTKKVFTLEVGANVADRTIEAIEDRGVTFRIGTNTQRLALVGTGSRAEHAGPGGPP